MDSSSGKFSINLTEIKTGETKDVVINAPYDLATVLKLLKIMFDQDKYIVNDIVEVKSIVKISISPICPN